jgi:hypothetical protein
MKPIVLLVILAAVPALAWDTNIPLPAAWGTYLGQDTEDRAGYSAAMGGDVDNDGYADLVIGADRDSITLANQGQVYVILGGPTVGQPNLDVGAAASGSWVGEAQGDFAGASVAVVGDVNNDGYDDIAVGAPGNSEGAWLAGQVYVIFGRPTIQWSMGVSLQQANASFHGEDSEDRAGALVAPAGNVNGDAYDDFLIAVPDDNDNGFHAGQVYLILGRSTIQWQKDVSLSQASASFLGRSGAWWSSQAGWSAHGGGDLNGDSFDDFAIGAPFDSLSGIGGQGLTYVIFGKASGWTMDVQLATGANASFWGEGQLDEAGKAVAIVPSLNGDALAELVIGSPSNSDAFTAAGQTYVILGKTSGWTTGASVSSADASFWGEPQASASGVAFAGLGDFNGDGLGDLAIGGDIWGSGAGKTHIVWGRTSGWAMDISLSTAPGFFGEFTKDHSGRAIGGGGDVNGDGRPDLLIAAWENCQAAWETGKSYLFRGAPQELVPPQQVTDLAIALADTALDLTWSAVTLDTNGAAETMGGYQVFRKTEAYAGCQPIIGSIAELSKDQTAYHDDKEGVTGNPATNHYYFVVVSDEQGNRSQISNRVGEFDFNLDTTP